jgi:carbon monoxide dehydrogenase subunit G
MKIEGSRTLAAPRDAVYQRLLDPQSLSSALPGCEKLEAQPDGSYHATLKIGIALAKGTYQGRVEILDLLPPESFRMKVEGKGAAGFLKGEGRISLAALNAETLMSYSGEVQVGGMIASVGQRMMQAAAQQIVNQFFEAFSRQLIEDCKR